ncbi:glycosyltransferase family 1 protein [soil metagenome]
MKIAIVTDAWRPQINGVVTTLVDLQQRLELSGHEVLVIEPGLFNTMACPGYREIRLAWLPRRKLARTLREARPDAIHIATEGPLGLAARNHCLQAGLPFTTAFHSRFPDFLETALGMPAGWGYAALKWFHKPSSAVMAPSSGAADILVKRAFPKVRRWSHGIDLDLFKPGAATALDLPRPVFLFVGRVSREKNLEAFLQLDLPGSKVVAGDGPMLSTFRFAYPEVRWLGALPRPELVGLYNAADVFVHPSLTDTFGLVMLEALACGTPVAAFPVVGPLDVIGDSDAGVLSDDLRAAALACLSIPRDRPRARALTFDRDQVARDFVGHLARIDGCRAKKTSCAPA